MRPKKKLLGINEILDAQGKPAAMLGRGGAECIMVRTKILDFHFSSMCA